MKTIHVRTSDKKGRQENTNCDIINGYPIIQRISLIDNELSNEEHYSTESHVNKMISLLIFLMVR
jgi:hypothetical protein